MAATRKGYEPTKDDHRLLDSARASIRGIMRQEGSNDADLSRAGIPPMSLRWFFQPHSNPTLAALNRIANALGYSVELRFRRIGPSFSQTKGNDDGAVQQSVDNLLRAAER